MRSVCALILMLLSAAAGAQGLVDPTRPPGGMAESTAVAADSFGPVLQSVKLSQGRKVAVISGEMVALGGRYGSARLVKLTETEAVLKNGEDTTVLRLYPQVDKRAAGTKKSGDGIGNAGLSKR